MKILGGTNETVLSLLSAQAKLSQCHKKSTFVKDLEGPEERDTNNSAAANDSSLTAQHNFVVHHDSSSFLYDTKSQRLDTVSQRPTDHPLQLESFLETQSGCATSVSTDDSNPFGVYDVLDEEASQQIIRELESEWEDSQQINKQLPGDLDFDLALSEEMVSELQQTFDLSGDLACTCTPPEPGTTTAKRRSLATMSTQASDTTFTDLNNIVTPLSKFMRKSSDSTIIGTLPGYGTPELFSSCKPSHKKLTHLRGAGNGEQSQSSSFSPELFGPTPLVCRLGSFPTNIGATPSGLRSSRLHTPKRSLLHDSTLTTPLCQAAASESQASRLSSSGIRPGNSTPQTQSKELLSHTLSYTASSSSPDLFS
jgi:hypothetical protein